LIKPLVLGNKTFPVNLIQGPLAGVSNPAFRLLTWRFSKPAFCCTEMISCKALLQKSKLKNLRYTAKDPEEGPVCFQLFGNSPEDLAVATKMVTDFGADLIDFNCGCPVKKVRRQDSGSALLTDSAKIYQLIRAMKQNTHLPVSIKIRVEGGCGDKFNSEIAQAVSDAGADFLVVHGRHWTQHYETPCNYDEIKFFVDKMKIPVIGNGDVADLESLKKMFATGCAGAMIGRAGVGQPWLIGQLIAQMNGQEYVPPALPEVGKIFVEHVTRLAAMMKNERFAVLQARKIAKRYARNLKHKAEFCIEINKCEDLSSFNQLCDKYFS
jgi:tRNA-dihydrouridine synthase B